MKIFPAIDIKDKKCVRLIKGDFEWGFLYGTELEDQVSDFAIDNEGSFYLFGDVEEINETKNDEMFLVKFDSDGDKIWSKSFSTEFAFKASPRACPASALRSMLFFSTSFTNAPLVVL